MPSPSATPSPIQTPRILHISSASLQAQCAPGALQAVQLVGHEGINQLFHYTLTLQTPDTPLAGVSAVASTAGASGIPGALVDLDLQALIGQALSCHIQLEGMGTFVAGSVGGFSIPHQGAGERQISTLITAATLIQETPRQRVYQFTLQPWLALADLHSDCKVFQDMSAAEVIEQVLASYPYPSSKRLIERYPVRDYCVQYNESDLQFITRLMQEWGINYHFEHSGQSHRLIWSDHNAAFQIRQEDLQQDTQTNPSLTTPSLTDTSLTNPYHTIPYYPLGHKTDREYIHRFNPVQRLGASVYASADYDYTRPQARLGVHARSDHPASNPAQEIYLWRGGFSAAGLGRGEGGSNGGSGGLAASDYSQPLAGVAAAGTQSSSSSSSASNHTEPQGQHLARLRLQALRQHTQRAHGAGHIRGIVPGSSFTLALYPQESANTEYIVVHTTLDIENPSEHKTGKARSNTGNTTTSTQGQWRILTEFEVQPATLALRPDGVSPQSPLQPKPLIAGPLSALVVGPAGANHHTDYLSRIKVHFAWDRHDSADQRSSCWVRVASPWAGNQLGAVHVPRIGQEVLVAFEGGDPDKPLVMGSVYNQNNQPPWELPAQQALSGLRSRELQPGQGNAAGGRSNHVLLDDTAEQLQVQLKSDYQHSSLSLGHITRIEDRAGRQEHRGEGFELRTDGHGAIRAQEGLLISTEARPNAQGHVKALSETAARLSSAQAQHQSLGHLAAQHQAQEAGSGEGTWDGDGDGTGGGGAGQGEVARALQVQNEGIEGRGAQAANATNTANTPNPHPELSAPHLVLASPAGIQSTTAGSTHQHSQQHHAITAGGHGSTSVGRSWLLSAKEAIKVFAYNTGIKLVSAREDINIQALQMSVNLLAQEQVRLSANEIILQAQKKVVLNAAGSAMQWHSGGMEEATSGHRTVHAKQHGVTTGASVPLDAPKFPMGQCIPCLVKALRAGLPIASV